MAVICKQLANLLFAQVNSVAYPRRDR